MTHGDISFFVSGEPRPKQSFRVVGNGKRQGYTPAHIKAWQSLVAWQAKTAMLQDKAEIRQDNGLIVRLDFLLPDNHRRDLDNLSKAVLDALNGILWKDDNQITKLIITKRLEKSNPGVIITLLGKDTNDE